MTVPVILAIDDSADDLLLTEIAFRRTGIPVTLITLRSSLEAIEYLTGRGGFQDRVQYPFPNILLLDLFMPEPNGFEVLDWLRTAGLPPVTVAALSGSPDAQDRARAFSFGAHYFISKHASTLQRSLHTLLLRAAPSPPSSGSMTDGVPAADR